MRNLFLLLLFINISCSVAENDISTDNILMNAYSNVPSMLRVMTYNIGDFSGKDFSNGCPLGKELIQGVLYQQEASIIGLQEDVFTYGDEHVRESIFNMFPFYYQRGSSLYNYKGFASLFPIHNIREVEYASDSVSFSHPYFLAGEILTNNHSILVVSFHFDWDDKFKRRIQIEYLIAFASVFDTAILMGDTNCCDYQNGHKLGNSSLHEEEWSLFQVAGYDMANNGKFGLFSTFMSGAPLDNIFVKGCHINDAFVVEKDYMNDHFILVADVAI